MHTYTIIIYTEVHLMIIPEGESLSILKENVNCDGFMHILSIPQACIIAVSGEKSHCVIFELSRK